MNWLIWKEFRLQLPVLVVGVFLFVAPFPVALYAVLHYGEPVNILSAACVASIALSVLTLALLGGNSFACERADRSAQYQSYQPISRWKILISKLILPLATMSVVWGIDLFGVALTYGYRVDILPIIGTIVISGLCAFGVSWLLSTCWSSPTFAAASGIIAPLALMSGIHLVAWLMESQALRNIRMSFLVLGVSVAIFCFAGGVWHYLRRVEP